MVGSSISSSLSVTPASHLSNLPGSCAQEIWYMPTVPFSRHLGLCLGMSNQMLRWGHKSHPPSPCQASRVLN